MDFPTEFPVLETSDLILREKRDEDAPGILQVFSDPKTVRYWSHPVMQSLDEAKARIARGVGFFADRSAVPWGLIRRDTGELVGTLDVFHFNFQHRRGEIGYSLHSSYWGRGWMSAAMKVALDWTFSHLELHRLEADTDPRNENSIRLLERLGFQREGTLREKWYVAGEISDSAIFGLLRPEWEARRTKKEEGE